MGAGLHGTALGYNDFAALYDRYWGRVTVDRFLPVYDRLVLGELPPASTVLDLCCGTGQLAAVLTQRGHRLIGVDAAPRLLFLARRNAPDATFVAADARFFGLGPICQVVVSTFDSLNHVLSLDELELVFRNVRRALVPGGRFVFDLNMEAGYEARWNDSFGFVADDHACVVRTRYDRQARLAAFDLTTFTAQGGWRRRDITLVQRPYRADEVLSALRRAGFADPAVFDAEEDLGLVGDEGRAFFVCRRPSVAGERIAGRGALTG